MLFVVIQFRCKNTTFSRYGKMFLNWRGFNLVYIEKDVAQLWGLVDNLVELKPAQLFLVEEGYHLAYACASGVN